MFSLTDISSWFTGNDNIASQEQSDAELAALNNADYAPGGSIYDQIQATQGTAAADAAYAQVQSDDASSAASTASINSDVAGAFTDGLSTGLSNIGSFLKNPFLSIPTWIWITGAVALFVFMGGLSLIRGILKKSTA